MQKTKASLGIKREDRFIIPPIQKRLLTQHYQTRPFNSQSIKRNIIFSSIRDESINLQHRPARSKSNHKQFLQTKTTEATYQAAETVNKFDSKFKIIKDNKDGLKWQKWKKRNYDISGKRFFKLVEATIMMKQNKQSLIQKEELFKLRHKIRDLKNMKQNIQKGKANNLLISALQKESNHKMEEFFIKYQQQIKGAHIKG